MKVFYTDRLSTGPLVLRSRELERRGVNAAFTTRLGGVSEGPYRSLNMAFHVGDRPEDVHENRRRVLDGLGIDPERVVGCEQVHGSTVVAVEERPEKGWVSGADGLVTTGPLTLVAFFADCVPVFIFDPVRGVIALVHAGWRGTAKRIVARAVKVMEATYGSRPGDCLAVMGPSIRRCCYEVEAEVIRAMPEVESGWVAAGRGRYYLDLPAVNAAILRDSGVGDIWDCGLCTACDTSTFYSYRAEGGVTGRMAAIVTLGRSGAS